jgi:hypothetical protein
MSDHEPGGANPAITKHASLRSLVRASIGAAVAMAWQALVIPLGRSAEEATAFLVAEGLLEPGRCSLGFAHPSGAIVWRAKQFAERKTRLARPVAASFQRPGRRADR